MTKKQKRNDGVVHGVSEKHKRKLEKKRLLKKLKTKFSTKMDVDEVDADK